MSNPSPPPQQKRSRTKYTADAGVWFRPPGHQDTCANSRVAAPAILIDFGYIMQRIMDHAVDRRFRCLFWSALGSRGAQNTQKFNTNGEIKIN